MHKYFPKHKNVNLNKLQLANNSTYSITKPNNAQTIQTIIDQIIPKKDLVIIDGTANVGGDTINFALNDNIKKVISIEKNPTTFQKLKHNIETYNLQHKVTTLNDDLTKIIDQCSHPADILFIDAPWGGPSYKFANFLDLELSGIKLYDIVKKAVLCNNIDYLVLKVPFNYNTKNLLKETSLKKIEIYKIKNYLLIIAKLH